MLNKTKNAIFKYEERVAKDERDYFHQAGFTPMRPIALSDPTYYIETGSTPRLERCEMSEFVYYKQIGTCYKLMVNGDGLLFLATKDSPCLEKIELSPEALRLLADYQDL